MYHSTIKTDTGWPFKHSKLIFIVSSGFSSNLKQTSFKFQTTISARNTFDICIEGEFTQKLLNAKITIYVL